MSEERTHGVWQSSDWSSGTGELQYGGGRLLLRGRALRLIVWIATRQKLINAAAAQDGQLRLTWKGESERAMRGELLKPL